MSSLWKKLFVKVKKYKKKRVHRFVLLFDSSLSLLPATEWCNKNIWLHAWFSRETLLKIADILLRFYVASREIDKKICFPDTSTHFLITDP